MKIKPLTFGQASFFYKGQQRNSLLRNRVLEFSEKQDAIFWNIKDHLFCTFIDDNIYYLEAMKKDEIIEENFSVYRIGIESMTIRKMQKKYSANEDGILEAEFDSSKRKLVGKFLSRTTKI